MKIVRACIYPKAIQCITGRNERYGRNHLNKVKVHFGKETHQFITVKEFSKYSGIDLESIKQCILD